MSRASRWSLWVPAAAGLLAAVAVESLAAAKQSDAEQRLLGVWLTDTVAPARLIHLPQTPITVVAAALVLVLAWLCVLVRLSRTPVPRTAVAVGLACVWTSPFLLGVPILSRDCYASLAQGEVMRRGWDPYVTPVGRLGSHDLLAAAVDPLWRGSVPPYGPVALRLSGFAAWAGHQAGHPQVGLLVLRLVAVAGIVLATACICAVAPVHRRPAAIWLMMSPLTLLQLIGAIHWEGLVIGLMAAAVLAMRRYRSVTAVICMAAACCVKITAGSLFAVLVMHSWQHTARGSRLRKATRLTAAALLTIPVIMVASGGADAWGWVRGLSTPASVWDPLTPANEMLMMLGHVAAWSGTAVPGHLAVALHTAAAGVGIAAAIAICRGASHRDPCLTGAYLVADLALCGPVLWPWYFALVIVLLLASQTRRGWLYAAVCGASSALWVLPLRVVQMQRVAFAAQVCAFLTLALWGLSRSRGNAFGQLVTSFVVIRAHARLRKIAA